MPVTVGYKPWHVTKQHGLISRYHQGCRCRACTDACRDAQRRQRLRKRRITGYSGYDAVVLCMWCGLPYGRGLDKHELACPERGPCEEEEA